MISTPAIVTAAVTAMNAWEAEGRALRAEAQAAPWPQNTAIMDQVQSRNWGDVAGDFARWENDPSDAIEFRVADAPEWLVCYNDQTREWKAVYSPEEEPTVNPAALLNDERLEGLEGATEAHVEQLARLLANLPGSADILEKIQENRNDGDPVTGWPSFLAEE